MGPDLATLGFRVESGDADIASRRLDQLVLASSRAERAATGLATSHRGAATATGLLSNEARGMASALAAVDGPLGGVAGRMRALVSTMRESGLLFGGVALGISAIGFSAAGAIEKTIAFQNSMAEVSTLVNTAKVNMGQLRTAVLAQSDTFAQAPTDEAKALYQIISAGATNAKTATEYLTAANKLAMGGITDIFTAADGLTSIMNAYAGKVKSVQDVSDSLFVAMRDGKTTIGELASSLGRVAPIAATTGVSLDELDAAIAAITTGGINTDEAVTGMRDILTAIVHPTTMATKEAHALGLQFTTTALRAEGLQKFLTVLMEKTHANTDVLAALFGNVRGIIPILSLAGSAGQKFTQIMDDMAHKTGSTADAVNKMNTPGHELSRVYREAGNETIQFADGLVTKLGPAAKYVADNMGMLTHRIGLLAEGALVVFAARIAGRVVPALYSAAAAQVEYSAAILSGRAVELGSVGAIAMRAKAVSDEAVAELEAAKAAETRAATNVAAIRSDMAMLDAEIALADQRYRAQITDKGRQLQIEAITSARQAQLQITTLLTEAEAELGVVQRATSAAEAQATAATEAYNAALAETGMFARAAATATGALDTALAFVGGPVGAAVLALGAAFYELYERSNQSADAMKSMNDQMIQAAINADQADIAALKYLSTLAQYSKFLAFMPGLGTSFIASGDLAQRYIASRIKSLRQDSNSLQGAQAQLLHPVQITPNQNFSSGMSSPIDNWKPPSIGAMSRSAIIAHEISMLQGQGRADQQKPGAGRDVILEQLKVEQKLRAELRKTDKTLSEQELDSLSKLKPAEAERIAQIVRQNDEWKRESAILDGLTKRVDDYHDAMKALDALQAQGKITPLQRRVSAEHLAVNQNFLGLEHHLGGANPFGASAQLGLAASKTAASNTKDSQLSALKDAQNAGVVSTEKAAKMRALIEEEYNKKIGQSYTDMYSKQLMMGETTFGKLADAVGGFAGKSSGAYKALFAISKAFAIAQAEVNIQAALSEALNQPFPKNLADYATVAAEGASIIEKITSVAGFANGVVGVQGPGTGTSDSILARLSNGESVVTAAGTQGNQQTLAAINSGAKLDAMAANGNGGVTVAPVFNIDARGAQQGVAEQIDAKMQDYAPKIVAVAISEAQKRSPGWVASANRTPRKR